MRFPSFLAICTLGLAFLAPPALATECVGRNLIDDLKPELKAELQARVIGVPNREGIFWKATKDGVEATIIGTYHFQDVRHDATLTSFGPVVDEAAILLVEAGPEEMAKLTETMTKDPTIIADPEGPTLPERLSKNEWDELSKAMADRGLPAFISSRLRPWYVAMMMGISPCMMKDVATAGGVEGLDQLLVDRAEAAGVPVRALEPWNTILTLFEGMTPDEEIDMIRASLPAAKHADDYATTLTDAYFDQDVWTMWEFGRVDAYENSGLSRAEVDEQMAVGEEKLMVARNKSWIAPINAAAAEAKAREGNIVVAFGALHLPGENGVISLLEKDGWSVSRLLAPDFEQGQN